MFRRGWGNNEQIVSKENLVNEALYLYISNILSSINAASTQFYRAVTHYVYPDIKFRVIWVIAKQFQILAFEQVRMGLDLNHIKIDI